MQVLLPEGQVEAQLPMQRGDVLGRRLIAEHGDGEIAGQQVGDQEGEGRNREDDGNKVEDPPPDQAEHEPITSSPNTPPTGR
jgi:hypothetical protein